MKDDFPFADPATAKGLENHAMQSDRSLPDAIASLIDPLERIRSLEHALDSLGQALVLLGQDAKIFYVSPHAMRILQENDGLTIVNGAFCANLEEDHRDLASALDTLLERNETPVKLELNIHRPSGKLPYKLRVNALIDTQQAMAIIQDTHANHMAWYDRLQARFQLTPRECQCTMLLTDGYSMAEIADRMGVSMQTLRQHLKHAFNKTGTHKQHELVGIVLQMQRKR
jgi:DNA-binding CsgD family transcriptional regulator